MCLVPRNWHPDCLSLPMSSVTYVSLFRLQLVGCVGLYSRHELNSRGKMMTMMMALMMGIGQYQFGQKKDGGGKNRKDEVRLNTLA